MQLYGHMRVSQVVGWSAQNLYLCAVILTVGRYFEAHSRSTGD